MIVPVTAVEPLPLTDAGATVRFSKEAGRMLSEAVWALVPVEAVSAADTDVFTAEVATLNLTELVFTFTYARDGTVADLTEEERLTMIGPVEVAGVAFRVTFPLTLFPPTTTAGAKVTEVMAKG